MRMRDHEFLSNIDRPHEDDYFEEPLHRGPYQTKEPLTLQQRIHRILPFNEHLLNTTHFTDQHGVPHTETIYAEHDPQIMRPIDEATYFERHTITNDVTGETVSEITIDYDTKRKTHVLGVEVVRRGKLVKEIHIGAHPNEYEIVTYITQPDGVHKLFRLVRIRYGKDGRPKVRTIARAEQAPESYDWNELPVERTKRHSNGSQERGYGQNRTAA